MRNIRNETDVIRVENYGKARASLGYSHRDAVDKDTKQ
jgi:hypothetical protein